MNLLNFRKNYYSQNGEDGVIEEIFRILEINSGFVCEFGAWDGIHLSNTFRLYEKENRFVPILIEAEEEGYKEMEKNLSFLENKFLFNHFVSPHKNSESSLDNILNFFIINKGP